MGLLMGKARLALLALVTCGTPPPPAPSAIITASPASVCIDDGFATDIELDATNSARRLTLVPAPGDPDAAPLQFEWSFSGSQIEIQGDPSRDHLHDEQLTVRMKGDRPLHVKLHVVNGEKGTSDALVTISITPRNTDGTCPLP